MVGFRFDDATIETRKGERLALVLTPTAQMHVGRKRLEELKRDGTVGEIDLQLIDRVRFSKVQYDVVVFRGRGESDEHVYRLDESLSMSELSDLSKLLVLTQLRAWRSLLELQVPVVVHSEFGSSAMHFRNACRELAEDPHRDPAVGARVANIDEWVLRNLIFFFSQTYEATMSSLLPDKLPLLETRRDKIELFAQVLREEDW